MPSNVFANMMGVSHKGSGAKSLVFPDVCKTPTPGGPVPIPYPNLAQSMHLAKGSKTVKVQGKSATIKGCNYSMSVCDEPGTLGGIISGTFKNKAEFVLYSFNVKYENKNVCRMSDLMFHNKKNIVG